MDRGQDLGHAKQSFLNAGYSAQEVESAVRKIGGISRVFVVPEGSAPLPPTPLSGSKMLPIQRTPASPKKRKIVIIVISVIILLVAGLLGRFWGTLFGG